MSIQNEIRELIERVQAASREYDRLMKYRSKDQLGPPATDKAISRVEKEIGRKFPEDYRAFLSLHNGWRFFSGASHLLSTDDMMEGPLRERAEELKRLQRAEGDKRAEAGFIIEVHEDNPVAVYLDLSKERADGGFDVVVWEYEPMARYRSFRAYLEEAEKGWRSLIDQEGRKKRKKSKAKKSKS